MWTAEDKQQVMCTCGFNHFNLSAQHQCLLAVFFIYIWFPAAAVSRSLHTGDVSPRVTKHRPQNISGCAYRWPRCNTRWSGPAAGRCLRGRFLLGRCRAHRWSPPRTKHTNTHTHSEGAECWNDVILLWNINKLTYKYMQMCLTPNCFHCLHLVKV